MEEEKYMKCTECQNASGLIVDDNQNMHIFCGFCNKQTLFEFISKEEFETIQNNQENNI